MESLPTYFSINVNTLILILIILAGASASFYYYRKTIPPVKRNIAVILGLLRGSYLMLILLLLFRPEITFSWISNEKKQIVVAVDRSSSMSLIEKNTSRIQRANAFADALTNSIDGNADIRHYAFNIKAEAIEGVPGDTVFSSTDITKSLLEIIDENPDVEDVIFITDGNFTEGKNPLYEDKMKQIRIYPVGIGDSLAAPDVKIINLEYDFIAYEQKPTSITANVSLIGSDTDTVRVDLYKNQRVVQAQRVELTGDGQITPVSFTVQPEETGLQRYSVVVQSLNEETVLDNNNSDLTMEVLQSKIIVGLIASKPNYDLKFLRQTIESLEDCEPRFFIDDLKLGSLEQIVQDADVLFLQNYPGPGQGSDRIELFNTLKKPVCYILSERLDSNKSQLLRHHFPIESIQNRGQLVTTQILRSERKKDNPLLALYEKNELNERFWNQCPPIVYPFTLPRFTEPVSTLLVTEKAAGSLPVLCSWHNNKLLLLGSGFWRWKFLLIENREFADGYQRFIKHIIHWLAAGKGNQNIILKMPKKVYHTGETVVFPVQLYDGTFNTIDNGMVSVNIVYAKDTSEVVLQNDGNGNYIGEYIPSRAGRYKLLVNGWRNDVSLGRIEEEIEVLSTNSEFIYTRQDVDFLRQLANHTGGRYYNESQATDLINALDLTPKKKEEQKRWDIWQNIYILGFLILLFSIEWIIRKRKGLA
jgi:hypothetical protein